jgi:hypothetical protein
VAKPFSVVEWRNAVADGERRDITRTENTCTVGRRELCGMARVEN